MSPICVVISIVPPTPSLSTTGGVCSASRLTIPKSSTGQTKYCSGLDYAQKLLSSPGKQDGLYWEDLRDRSALKSFAAAAADQLGSGVKPVPYHGYCFRILTAQGADAPGGAVNYVVNGKMIGGFAMVAWPAEYSVSGIQTFIVSYHGIVYQRDLGPNTDTLARGMVEFNPDRSWRPVELE